MPRSHRPKHAAPVHVPVLAIAIVVVLVGSSVAVWATGVVSGLLPHRSSPRPGAASTPSTSPVRTTLPSPSVEPSPTPTRHGFTTPGPINASFPGLTTFRGNATRDYYGEGPVPRHPVVLWSYPATGGMCATSTSGTETKRWCGTGWTGQPNVIPHPDGTIEIREGAYDDHYHFWNGLTGEPLRPDLVTGDLAKGSATSDADGYPLYYAGSRDNLLRVVAMDRPTPTVLWSVNSTSSVPNPVWNSDWDGAPLQIGDYLLEGGENSWFYVIRLHRHYDAQHLVQVDPKIVLTVPGWDQDLLNAIHDTDISIENSVAFSRGVAYFSNSGGLVQGWDISNILHGGTKAKQVFRFWAGDDVDASVVIDKHGFLYVARHIEENVSRPSALPRDHEIGGLMKLDPRKPSDPVVWSVPLGSYLPDGGSLSTPALYHGIVYGYATDGELIAVDQKTGHVYWSMTLPGPDEMSPVPIDHVLIVGDCSGVLHGFDISHPKQRPDELWHVNLYGCVESTPAVWHGMIWVGARGGKFYGIGDRT
jgi:outer membrane protein assembly factor BamB